MPGDHRAGARDGAVRRGQLGPLRGAVAARAGHRSLRGNEGRTCGRPFLPTSGRCLLLEARCGEALDLAAAARLLEPGADDLVLDDDERRHRLDLEPLYEVRPLLLVDAVELERSVIPAPLQHLGKEALDAAA